MADRTALNGVRRAPPGDPGTAGPTVTARRTVPAPAGLRARPAWIFGAPADLVLALGWLPVFAAWHVLDAGSSAGASAHVQQGVALALLISFLHQPLTFGLVYGDRRQLALHRRLFLWAPVVALVVAVPAAAHDWWVVVPVAAVWNLQHTLQQRYGVQRIYAGRAGYGAARLDRAAVYLPMAAVLLAVAALPTLGDLVRRSGLDPRNAGGVELLARVRPLAAGLLPVAIAATVVVGALVVRQERRAGPAANPAKWLYQGGQLALLASIVLDPVAGFVAYVTAHAVEYAVIVERTARRRYAGHVGSPPPAPAPGTPADRPPGGAVLGALARRAPGRIAFFGAIAGVALAVKWATTGALLDAVVYCVGALHFTYDAVIWKLRRPAVARDLGVPAR